MGIRSAKLRKTMVESTEQKYKEVELGFGNKNYKSKIRFLNKNGSVNIRRKGIHLFERLDVYHWLITTKTSRLLTIIFISYIIVNLLFACVYFALGPESFGGISVETVSGKFMALFFFSAQTLTTVGYGHIYPVSSVASVVAAIESMMGLLGFALATGVVYGRFSRPEAKLLFSKKILISPYRGRKGLMFRIANTRQNELIEAEANITLAFTNPNTNKREFAQLPLERSKINFLTLSWTIVHPIDENSLFYKVPFEELSKYDIEVIILIKAINDTYSQNVYVRSSYKFDDLVNNAAFVPVKQEENEYGKIEIDLNDIHLYKTAE